jgi:hypothetical protein
MHESDLGGARSGPVWVPSRQRPRLLEQGGLAEIRDLIGGDRFLVGSLDGKRVRFGEVSWKWYDGSAQVHLGPAWHWSIPLGPDTLVRLPAERVVRVIALRPWTSWHESKE